MKCLAHTYKLTGSVADTLLLKMKCNHCLFCCSVAGTEYRPLCWFIQLATNHFACLTLSDDTVKHCYFTAGHTERHLGDERPIISCHRGERTGLRTSLLSLRNDRSWIWTACGWAAETTQDSFAFLILGVCRLREDQFICEETRENMFFIICDLYCPLAHLYQLNLPTNEASLIKVSQ